MHVDNCHSTLIKSFPLIEITFNSVKVIVKEHESSNLLGCPTPI